MAGGAAGHKYINWLPFWSEMKNNTKRRLILEGMTLAVAFLGEEIPKSSNENLTTRKRNSIIVLSKDSDHCF